MATQQPRLTLNDGNTIPQIGLGVWQVDDAAAPAAVEAALKSGYRLIDTAEGYANETGVGRGVKSSGVPREEIFVTSKLTNSRHGHDEALRACDESLERLGIDQLDLYLIHWPLPMYDLYAETWKAFVRLRAEGKVRSIGVSNFYPDHIERIVGETGVVPAVNQVELHPRFQQRALRAFHKQHDIRIESWSPLGSGRLVGDPALAAIGRKYGKTAAQVIIRWHVEEGLIVIPKSVTPARIRENFEVFDFALDEDDRNTIIAMDDPRGRIGADPRTASFR